MSIKSTIPQINNSHLQSNPSSSTSKLHQYFGSSQYICRQQQLCIFIQDFPTISLQNHKSLNDILPLLIRQNELLANKCQQQILLIKQSFVKHQNLIRNSKRVKDQLAEIQQSCQQHLQQITAQCKQAIQDKQKINTKFHLLQQFIQKQNIIIKCIINQQYKKCEQLTNQRSFRLVYTDYKQHKDQQNSNKQQLPVSLQSIQIYCKYIKKKIKYFTKVKSSVEDFCNRLIKISAIITPEVLTQQMQKECKGFLDLINILITTANGQTKKSKRNNSLPKNQQESYQHCLNSVGSQSSLISLERKRQNNLGQKFSQRQNNFFQELLLSIHNESQTTTLNKNKQLKKQIEQLKVQIEQLKVQLTTSKQYHQKYLINFKFEQQLQKRKLQEQLNIFKQTSNHYEYQFKRTISQKKQLQLKFDMISQEGKQNKQLIPNLKRHIQQIQLNFKTQQHSYKQLLINQQTQKKSIIHKHELKINQIQSESQLIQKKILLSNQQLKNQMQTKNNQIKQFDIIITTSKKNIKQLQQKIQDKETQLQRLKKRLNLIQNDQIRRLQQQVEQITIEIKQVNVKNKQLSKTNQQLSQQIQLQAQYIKQVQMKISKKQQVIQKLNKKLSVSEMSKKASHQQSQTILSLQSSISTLQSQLSQSQQQSLQLKRLLKELKSQLESVYHTLEHLKTIQAEREQLVQQNLKSDRWRQQITKDYDQMKYQILKAQAENKNLKLQVLHYRNSLQRLEIIN